MMELEAAFRAKIQERLVALLRHWLILDVTHPVLQLPYVVTGVALQLLVM